MGEAAREAAKAKEEIEKEKRMYEKYLYDTEMEQEVCRRTCVIKHTAHTCAGSRREDSRIVDSIPI